MIFIKEIGSIRKLDELGRIVIPKSVREMLNMDQGDNIEFFVAENSVVLKKKDAFNIREEEIYKLLQLYYIKYSISSVILENYKIVMEYGKDIEIIKEMIDNKRIEKYSQKVPVRIGYNDNHFYLVNLHEKYVFIIFVETLQLNH